MSTLCNAEREWQGNGWQGNGSKIPDRSYSPAVHSPAHLAQCSDGEIVEIPQKNFAKAATRVPAVFRLENAAMQCVAIEMGARSVTLVTLQVTGVGVGAILILLLILISNPDPLSRASGKAEL